MLIYSILKIIILLGRVFEAAIGLWIKKAMLMNTTRAYGIVLVQI